MAHRAHYDLLAWQLARQGIGQELRQRYPVPQELPHRLVSLIGQFDAAEARRRRQRASEQTSQDMSEATSSGWLKKLDAIEGDGLLRACRKHLQERTRRRD
jgi:hypothetical protein